MGEHDPNGAAASRRLRHCAIYPKVRLDARARRQSEARADRGGHGGGGGGRLQVRQRRRGTRVLVCLHFLRQI